MAQTGYDWTITEVGEAWIWAVVAEEGRRTFARGWAPSRAVAAAMIVRTLVRGMAVASRCDEGLAA